MVTSFLMALREGLEAALILGVVLGVLRQMGLRRPARHVWLGAGAAAAVSLAASAALVTVGARFEGRAERIFEGVTMIAAAAILTWMVTWMTTQGRQIRVRSERQAQQSATRAHHWGLFWLAFVAVVREGLELALFLVANTFATSTATAALAALAGIGAAAGLGWALYSTSIRLDVRRFFRTTSLLLVILAAGLVAGGVHELNEAGLIPPIVEHVWDLTPLVPQQSVGGQFLKALVGYNGSPSLTEALGYVLYLVFAWLLLRDRPQSRRREPTVHAAS